VTLLDVGGFNLLGGDADPAGADSLHARWEERDAVRRAWAAAVGRLEPTSVAWIPVLDYGHARRTPADSSRGTRGEGLAAPCALDSVLWAEGLSGAYGALGRLAAEQRTLVIALGLDIDGPRGYSMGQEFCDAAWRRGFGLPDRPLLLFTPELRTRQLLSLYRTGGLNLAHAVALPPASLAARDWTSLRHLVFEENDGFWLAADEAPSLGKRVSLDSLGRLLRRLAR